MQFFDEDSAIAYGMGTMIVTDDGGLTWQFVPLPTGNINYEALNSFAMLDENTAIIVGYNNTFIKTTDKGHTWNNIAPNLPVPVNFVSVDFVNSQTGYVTGYSHTTTEVDGRRFTLKTTNGGQTWTQIDAYFNASFYEYVYTKFIDEENGFAWCRNNFYKTTDGGFTWLPINSPSGSQSWPGAINTVKITEGGEVIIALRDTLNSIYRSADMGETWTLISALSASNNIIVEDGIFDIVGNMLYTTGAVGPTNIKSFIAYNLDTDQYTSNVIDAYLGSQTCINMVNANTGYIIDMGNTYWFTTPGRKMLRTTDGGVNWTEFDSWSSIEPGSLSGIKIQQNGINTYTISKQDDYDNGLTDFYIHTSIDNGVTWQQKAHEIRMVGIFLRADGNYLSYIRNTDPNDGSQGQSLYESHDLGETWSFTSFNNPYDLGSNFYRQIDENTLLYGMEQYQIVLSPDKGQTWRNVPWPNVANIYFSESYVKSVNEIYVWGFTVNTPSNYDYSLYKSVDMGSSWQLVTTIPNNGANAVNTGVSTTKIGNDIAFVSTGNSNYYTIDLNDRSYNPLSLTNPNGLTYVNPNSIYLLNDTTWLIRTGIYMTPMFISGNSGQTWDTIPCLICGEGVEFNNTTGELLTYHTENGCERLFTSYAATTQTVLGNAVASANIQTYNASNILPGTQADWLVSSGGSITSMSENSESIEVTWTTAGEQTVKLRTMSECGESSYSTFSVNVGRELYNHEYVKNNIVVSPNPFTDIIKISSENLLPEFSLKVVSATGQVVYSNPATTSYNINLSKLAQGIYFMIINNDGSEYVKKIIKK